MIYYKVSTNEDLEEIVAIHLKAFPNFFLSSLGQSFLKTYYKSCYSNENAVIMTAINTKNENVVGFGLACYQSRGFHKDLILKNLRSFIRQGITLLFIKPRSILRLLNNLRKGNDFQDNFNYAELLSIAVSPDFKGNGIGKKLLEEIEKKVTKNNIEKITLTTDAKFNNYVLKFYESAGYKTYYEFISYPNRKMLKLIKDL